MKPLTEWTTDELRDELYDCGSQFDAALAELMRRERERCKDVVRSHRWACECARNRYGSCHNCLSLDRIVARIEALK